MRIDVVPVGDVDDTVIETAGSVVEVSLGFHVHIHDPIPVPDEGHRGRKNQVNAERLIEKATEIGMGDKNLALTNVDIYYNQRNFVFGLAHLERNGCVVSTYRLNLTADGGTVLDSSGTFTERLRKEVTHEIGHTLGLGHCEDDGCVMSFSEDVTGVDRKSENPCDNCRGVFP